MRRVTAPVEAGRWPEKGGKYGLSVSQSTGLGLKLADAHIDAGERLQEWKSNSMSNGAAMQFGSEVEFWVTWPKAGYL